MPKHRMGGIFVLRYWAASLCCLLAQQGWCQSDPVVAAAAASAVEVASVAVAAAPANAAVVSPVEEYRLGPGDQIRITVYQSPDLSLETRLTEAGSISYPLLGTVQLGGLSVREAETHLAIALRNGGFVRNPQVILLVSQVRANQINVLGMVARPGRYPLEVAGMRFTEVLAMVGGVLSETGSDTVVILGKRNNQQVRIEIDVPSIFTPDGYTRDVVVQAGDVIWVERAPQVYLQGEFNRPGPMRLGRNMTLMHVIAAAGGISQRGTLRGLQITRRNAKGQLESFEPSLEDSLRDGDLITVRESLF